MKSKYKFLVSDYKPQSFLQSTVDFFMEANYPQVSTSNLSKGFDSVRLFPTSTSVPNLATKLIEGQPSIGISQAFDDQALLLFHVGDSILQADVEFGINGELAPALFQVTYYSICHFDDLPANFISGGHRGSAQRLIADFYGTITPPVDQLTYLYQTSPCSFTGEPSLRFMAPRGATTVQSNADFFAQLLSTCYMRTPFFGSLFDVDAWDDLNRCFLADLEFVGYDYQDQVALFGLNAHGSLHEPDPTIPLADQDFLRTAPLLGGLNP